ncbi:MAG: hypothetical protein JEZ09_12930 [Salinivirgaceae bacterium]|nr:hypothetical protein [Salinivirgaceae bacterium]
MDSKKNSELIKDLFAVDKKIVTKAITDIRNHGNNELLKALIKLYDKNDDKELRNTIAGVFNDLKDQKAGELIIQSIRENSNKDVKKMLISSCWQSRLNYMDYLELFIDIVLCEDFILSFEAFTVIENIEEKTTAERKNKLINYITTNIGKCINDNKALADDLVQIVSNYDNI